MRVPRVRFQLWMFMIAVAVSAGLMVEVRQRQERFIQLCEAHHRRADACFDRAGRICTFGETPQSIEAFYRGRGPTLWSDYKMGLYHCDLAYKYEKASCRPWLPMLPDPPPPNGFSDLRALAWWGLETLLAAAPWILIYVLLLTLRVRMRKAEGWSSCLSCRWCG